MKNGMNIVRITEGGRTMPISVRTNLALHNIDLFNIFLEGEELNTAIAGEYEHIDDRFYTSKYICYAYSAADSEKIMFLTIKFGSIEAAYINYKHNWSKREITRVLKERKNEHINKRQCSI